MVMLVVIITATIVWLDTTDVNTLEDPGTLLQCDCTIRVNLGDAKWANCFWIKLITGWLLKHNFHTWLPIKWFAFQILTEVITLNILLLLHADGLPMSNTLDW